MENKNLGGIDKYLNKIILADYRDIIKDFPDKCIDIILTDPPYGGECEAAERGRFKKYDSEFQNIKSFGAAIIFLCRRLVVFLFGTN